MERIKTIRVFLILMSITFLLADLVYNIIGPSFDILNAITETKTGHFDNHDHMMGNSKLQLMLDIKLQLVFLLNLQILLFYHKLRFGEHSRIIDFGDADSNELPMRRLSEKEEVRKSGTNFESTSENSLKNLLAKYR